MNLTCYDIALNKKCVLSKIRGRFMFHKKFKHALPWLYPLIGNHFYYSWAYAKLAVMFKGSSLEIKSHLKFGNSVSVFHSSFGMLSKKMKYNDAIRNSKLLYSTLIFRNQSS